MSRLGGASRFPFLFARNSAQEVLNFGRDSRMNTKPMIAVNADFRAASAEHIALTWITSGYYDQISGAKTAKSPGGIPMIVPPLAEEDDLRAFLEKCDGVVLGGCSLDLDPKRLGFDKHPATKQTEPRTAASFFGFLPQARCCRTSAASFRSRRSSPRPSKRST